MPAEAEDDKPKLLPAQDSASPGNMSGLGIVPTTTNRWAGTGQEQIATDKSGTKESSSMFTHMPPAPASTPATDPYPDHGGASTAAKSTNTPASDAASDASSYKKTTDIFQSRNALSTPQSHVSQRQTDSYLSQSQAGTRTSSDWRSGSMSSAPGTAVASSEMDSTASAGAGQSALAQDQTFQQDSSSGRASRGSSLRIQPSSQYATDNSGLASGSSSLRTPSSSQYPTGSAYTSADTHGHAGGTATQAKSPSSSYGQNTPTQDFSGSARDNSSTQYGNSSTQHGNTSTQYGNSSTQYGNTSTQYGNNSSTQYGNSSTQRYSGSSQPAYSSQQGLSDEKATGRKYVIQPDDSYWKISEKRYGTGSYFEALQEHNRALFPDSNMLGVNKEIETPDESELQQLYPSLCPTPEHREASKHRSSAAGRANRSGSATVYVVQEGDTLFDIARYELGKASRWADIYNLNRDRLGKDFDYLTPGLELAMPSAGTQADKPVGVMTQRFRCSLVAVNSETPPTRPSTLSMVCSA